MVCAGHVARQQPVRMETAGINGADGLLFCERSLVNFLLQKHNAVVRHLVEHVMVILAAERSGGRA